MRIQELGPQMIPGTSLPQRKASPACDRYQSRLFDNPSVTSFLYRVKDFFRSCFFSLISCLRWIFCCEFLKKGNPDERMIMGSISQYDAVRRGVCRSAQPGFRSCTYIASQAVYQFLRGELNSSEQIDRAVFQGLTRAFNHYGMRISPSLLSEENIGSGLEALQGVINQLDGDPSYLDGLLSTMENREWFEIETCFVDRLVSGLDFRNPDQIRSLCQDRIENLKEAFYEKLQNFASLSQERTLGGLLIAPPATYGICLKKNENGEVEEVAFFDSHGYSSASPAAYVMRWTRGSLDPLNAAATFLANLRSVERFMITPLRLRGSMNNSYQG